jgi:CBS domain containing-hemolysin-like protein
MLVGNNAALVFYTYFAGSLIVYFFWSADSIEETSHPYFTLLVQTVITTIVVLFAAEFIPKALFKSNPNRWLYILAFPIIPILLILYIPAVVVSSISMSLLKLLPKHKETSSEVAFGKVDLDHYLRELTESVQSDEDMDHEIQIFQNALEFSNIKARECMVPRNEIVALELNDDVNELRDMFVKTGLSKILIYRDSIDNIIGYVHSYELFKKPEHIKTILLPVSIVPEPMSVHEVLEILILQKKNMAVVVDEFGGTSGILTMEDIVEEIFGEIEDEHDTEELTEKDLGNNEFLFSARLEIDYLNDKYKLDLPILEEYDTLGGLVIHHCEDIPPKGTLVESEDYTLKVTSVSGTRIEEVMLKKRR